MNGKIVLLPGDGIGPEVVKEGRLVLEQVAARFGHRFEFEQYPMGGISIDVSGVPLTPTALNACLAADAVLLGAVGGPKWDDPKAPVRPEQGLLELRKKLGLYANLRPVKVLPELADCSPIRPERLAGVDILVIRELTGGLYFGRPKGRETVGTTRRAVDTLEYTDVEIRRVVKLACELAGARRGKVTSIDKANVLESSRLWRDVTNEVAADFPKIKLDHQLVDSAAMKLVTSPAAFDVIVTENMFGDILTDEAAVLAGSLGMCPSASLGEGTRGLYEPIHGSAPDIAGKGIANPIGTILSVAMLLRHSFGLEKEAAAVESAVTRAIEDGARTADLCGAKGKPYTTSEMGAAIRAHLDDHLATHDFAFYLSTVGRC